MLTQRNMPAKRSFTPAELDVIRAAAKRVFDKKFAWMKRTKEHPGGQEAMGLALGLAQQSVSNLLRGTYNPGWKVASNIANLDGQTLPQLLAHADMDEAEVSPAYFLPPAQKDLRNLQKCLDYHEEDQRWSPWTIAATKAGYFGKDDLPVKQWEERLDGLEKTLARARKAG